MKTKIIFFIFLVSSLNGFAQKDSLNRSLQIGYFYSADYTSASFDKSYGYNTGLNFLINLNQKLRMDIGLHFSNIGEHKDDLTVGSSYNPSTGTFDTTFSIRQQFQFIEIPIAINYSIFRGDRIKFYLVGGISPSYYIRTMRAYDYYPSSGSKIEGEFVKKNSKDYNIVLNGLFGFGFEFKIVDRFNLHLQPSYRYYFAQNRLTAFGLNCGITYTFQ